MLLSLQPVHSRASNYVWKQAQKITLLPLTAAPSWTQRRLLAPLQSQPCLDADLSRLVTRQENGIWGLFGQHMK
jgi:hypothetical protein